MPCSLTRFRLVLRTGLLFLLSLTFFSSYAGERDSLISILHTHTTGDKTKVELLNALAATYVQSNIDSMELFASSALSLAENLDDDLGIATSFRSLGLVRLHRHDYEKALQYYNSALAIYEKLNDLRMQIDILLYLGDTYYRDAKYKQALELYSRVIPLAEKNHDLKSEGLALIDIGGIYTDQASYSEAVDYYLKGLRVFEEAKDNKGISMTLVNIANIYSAMGNYKKAMEYIDKSTPITAGITDKEVVFSNMVNAGVVYGQMKNYDHALKAFNKGLLIADSLGDKSWQNACLTNIADIYYQMGQFDSAYAKYTRLLQLGDELADTAIIPLAKAGIGAILVHKGKYQEAIRELLPALAIAQIKQAKQTIFDASKQLATAYELLHDYASALKYHKIAYAYRDSLNNDDNGKKIQQLQFDYELGKREAQIELLRKNHTIAENRIYLQRIIMWSSLSVLLLVIIICLLFYRNSVRAKRNSEQVIKQKEEIELQAIKLEELNRLKDKTFSVLSHDLRAPLGALTTAIGLIDEHVITVEDFMRIKPEIQDKLGSVNALLDNLLNWARTYIKGDLTGPAEPVDMHALVDSNIALADPVAMRKRISMHNKITPATFALGYTGQVDIVVRNLLSNAIKFSNDNSNITFNAVRNNGTIAVTIADEGIGMTEAQLNKLFKITPDMSTYGTGGEKGVGIGLLLCQEFIKANNGTLTVASTKDKGTTFTVTLPAHQ